MNRITLGGVGVI